MRRAPCKMAGSCAGLVILEPFAETRSFRNDRTFPTANFQLVPVGIFEKASVIAAAVGATDLWAFQILPADLAHEPGEPINFFTGISPKSDSSAVGLMTSILVEGEERFRLVSTGGKEDSQPPARAIAGKTKRW